ncbi:5'-nucleotidase C-terminal domain-containing protein [Fervidobacterium sp. 2310opik-2]|uniref:5'-nucleotidase C-terminal domain-containing protein n=1 Tax=Fervidobacterium sp. 2310opik-2 TaxID=1755815 RepID=UPI0013DF1E36|nr:5'-nucleotidase C-terminal domain-containing protein [Fervidobacterium sp. 2310opik-2]KAF2961578.1 peptidoglycan-binding protein [Fervidobacterium sp. 2310opik-2]
MSKKFITLFMFVLFALSTFVLASQIIILHTSNIYGNVLPYDYFSNMYQPKGLAILKTYVDNLRSSNPDTILIDTGNLLYGSPFGDYSSLQEDNPVINAFNLLNYDAFVPGTFEVNYSPERLIGVFKNLKTSVLAANLANVFPSNVVSFKVKTMSNGFKVAMIGVVVPYDSQKYVDYIESVRNTLNTAKKMNPDLIILATSGGITNDPITGKQIAIRSELNIGDELVREFSKDVDIFLFGNQDFVYTGSKSNKIYSVTGSEAKGVNKITLNVEKDKSFKIKSVKIERVLLSNVEPSEMVLNQVKKFEGDFNKWLDEVIAQSNISVGFNKYMAMLDDNFVTEFVNKLIINYTNSNLGIWNVFNANCPGIPQGEITRRDLYSLVGKTTSVKLVKMTGADIKNYILTSAKLLKYNGVRILFDESLTNKPWLYDLFENINYSVVLNENKIRSIKYLGRDLDDNSEVIVSVPSVRTYGTNPILRGEVIEDFEIPVQQIIFENLKGRVIDGAMDSNYSVYVKLEYEVKPGDTFNQILQRLAVTDSELLELNPIIKNINLIRPGWKLVYYKKYLNLIPPIREFFEVK